MVDILWIIFLILKYSLLSVEKIYAFLIGRPQHCQQEYEKSAEVCKIWFFHRRPPSLDELFTGDFIHTHERYDHPNIILNDNVTLFRITKEHAIFVDCEDYDVFNSKNGPFAFPLQGVNARKVIYLPLSSFHTISKDITLPNVPIIHLAHHGRCGSTVVTKVFEAIPHSLSISETYAFTDIAYASHRGTHDRDTLKSLCFSALMCTLKHANTRNSSIIFFKCQMPVVFVMDILMEAVPEIKCFYMHRDPVSYVRSFEKLIILNNWSLSNIKTLQFHVGLGQHSIMNGERSRSPDYLKNLSIFSKLSLTWISKWIAYKNLCAQGYVIKSLKYEELLEEPYQVMVQLFSFVNLSKYLVPNDLTHVMSSDSQAGSIFSSRAKTKDLNGRCTSLTTELKEEVNKLCDDFNSPRFWK